MIIKVCGLKDVQNLTDISQLNIDMVGYNFYKPSARYLDHVLPDIPANIKKVGVFVNASLDAIKLKTALHKLDYAQLHGDESLSFCKEVKSFIPVIKVFSIDDDFNPDILKDFDFCDMFLFDTATKNFGGSGQKFNWNILYQYDIKIPFLLSGGIGPNDVDEILKIDHPLFMGIDINSKFEISPGMKKVAEVREFVGLLKNKSASRYPQSLKGRPTRFEVDAAEHSPLEVGGEKGEEEKISALDHHSLKGRHTLSDQKAEHSPLVIGGKEEQKAKHSPLGDGGEKGKKNENIEEFPPRYPHSLKGRSTRFEVDAAERSPLGVGGENSEVDDNAARYPLSLKGRPTLPEQKAEHSPSGVGGEKGNKIKEKKPALDPHSLKGRPTLSEQKAELSPLEVGGEKGKKIKERKSSRNPCPLRSRRAHSLKGRPTLPEQKAEHSPSGVGGEKGSEYLLIYDMFYGATPIIFEKAAALRKKMTIEELKVWNFLKTKPGGHKFRRQHPINFYVADFYCHPLRLAIEIDGHNHQNSLESDSNRETIFSTLGIKTVRFSNNEVNADFENVMNKITREILFHEKSESIRKI
ncbi:MAG: DUF559 domain-containing protein [Saprospiraceae bacterium]|nr:DUF559 domain-containing protein [Saprospiraceae bacterium]